MLSGFILGCKKDINTIKTVFFSSLVIFLVSYIHSLTNEIAFHDNVWIESMGATFSLGRFFVSVVYLLMKFSIGDRFITTPVINGLVAFIFITANSYIIVKTLEIKNKVLIIFVSFIMMCNVVVGSIMSTRYIAIVYSLSLFLGTYSIYLYSIKKVNIIICSLLLTFSIGIYQAFIAFFISFALLYIIKISYENRLNIKETFLLMIKYFLLFLISIIIYFVLLKISLLLSNEKLSDYKNANTLLNVGIYEYINRILYTYRCYFNVKKGAPFFPFNTDIIYYLMFFISIILMFINKVKLSSGCILSILLFPIAIHSNAIMFGVENYNYSFMGYSIVFTFFIFIYFFDKNYNSIKNYKISVVLCILYLLVVFSNVYLNNLSSLNAEFIQSQAKTYFSNLIYRIESTDGYDGNMNVCFVNEMKKSLDGYDSSFKEFKNIKNYIFIYGMSFDDVINNYAWRRFMRLWNGYNPHVIPDDDFKNMDEVKNMPSYPQNGSIKIIDDVVVVKFNDY